MPQTRFDWILIALGTLFVMLIIVVSYPTFFGNGLNVVHAVDEMFANPYAAGVSIDIIFTYLVLAAWVIYEYQYRGVQHGWVSLVIGLVIGVAAALVAYLLVRHREIGPQTGDRALALALARAAGQRGVHAPEQRPGDRGDHPGSGGHAELADAARDAGDAGRP